MNQLYTLLMVLFVTNLFGQSITKKEYFSQDNVIINITPEDCIDNTKGTQQQFYFLEIINNNTSSVNVSFKKEIWYNNICQSCDSKSDEYKVNITVPSNNSLVGDCNSDNKSLRIFSKMLNLEKVRKLSKYELKNITVEIIK
jgi:protoporphyrinogen oxidase